jgi:hypothetical protein
MSEVWKVSETMKVVTIVKGSKLEVLYKDCNVIKILGNFDKVIFVDSDLNRFIRDFCGGKEILTFHGSNICLITHDKHSITFSGNIEKYEIADKEGRVGIIHYLKGEE